MRSRTKTRAQSLMEELWVAMREYDASGIHEVGAYDKVLRLSRKLVEVVWKDAAR